METTSSRSRHRVRASSKSARPVTSSAVSKPAAKKKPAEEAAGQGANPKKRAVPAPVARRSASGRLRYMLSRLGTLARLEGWNAMNETLNLKGMGITVAAFAAGKGYEHPHYHAEQEEVYLLAHGRGQMAIDGQVIDLVEGDIVRVDPTAVRALRSHPTSPSVWIMVGATPGCYRENDYTELTDKPAGF